MNNKINLQTFVVPQFIDDFLKFDKLSNLKQLFVLLYTGEQNAVKVKTYLIGNFERYGFDDPHDFLAAIKIFGYKVQPERISTGNDEIDEIVEFMTEEEYRKFYNFLDAHFQVQHEIEQMENFRRL